MASDVLIKLGAKMGKTKAFATISKKLDKVKQHAARALDFGKIIAAGTAAAAAGLAALVKNSADAGDALDKMSKRTNLSVKFLAGMQHASELSGSNIGDMEKAIRKMSQSASDANDGLATYTRQFDALGISVTNQKGQLKNTEELFMETVTALSQMENKTQQVAVASKIFGRSGTALLPMLTQGKKGLIGMMKESEQLGNVWTGKTATAAADMNDNLARIWTIAKNVGNTFANELFDGVAGATDTFIEFFKANKDVIMQDVKGWAQGTIAAFKILSKAGKDTYAIFSDIQKVFTKLNDNKIYKVLKYAIDKATSLGALRNITKGFSTLTENHSRNVLTTDAEQQGRASAQSRFHSKEAQDRLAKVRDRIHNPDKYKSVGKADAAAEQQAAEKAVNAYRQGRKEQEEMTEAEQRAAFMTGDA